MKQSGSATIVNKMISTVFAIAIAISNLVPVTASSQNKGTTARTNAPVTISETFKVTNLHDNGERGAILAANENVALKTSAGGAEIAAAQRGNPYINFESGKSLAAYSAIQANATPLALASGDFDGDGVEDLAVAYATADGGRVSIRGGNVESIFPPNADAQPAPFFAETRDFEVLLVPDFLRAGDFNADGKQDLLAAKRGFASLILLTGNGDGNFAAPQSVKLKGEVTAFTVGEVNNFDNLADVAVGIVEKNDPKILIFQNRGGAFSAEPEIVKISKAVNALAFGEVDTHMSRDLVAASGEELILVSGRVKTNAGEIEPERIVRRNLDFQIAALAIGDFTGERENEIAVLSKDGGLFLSEPPASAGGLNRNTRTFNLKETTISVQPPATTSGYDLMLAAKVSTRQKTDLIIASNDRLNLITNDGADNLSLAASFDANDAPIAVLPMRLNKDALNDLVVLTKNNSTPTILMTAPMQILTVSSAASSGTNTLRSAFETANNSAGLDEVRFAIPDPNTPLVSAEPFPYITEAVTLDATTQPGYAGRPIVTVRGDTSIHFSGGNSVTRGFVNNSQQPFDPAVEIDQTGNVFVENSFIGTDRDGVAAGDTQNGGVFITGASGNTIGGSVAQARNVIGGILSDGSGVVIRGAANNHVKGNYIGTDKTGLLDVGNYGSGVLLMNPGSGNIIGGPTEGERNIISASGANLPGTSGSGVKVIMNANAFSDVVIQNNFIGTNKNGDAALRNANGGVRFEYAATISPTATAQVIDNVISGNTGDGIYAINNAAALGSNAAPEIGIIGLIISSRSSQTAANASPEVAPSGNLIGTNFAGTAAVPNTGNGVRLNKIAALIERSTISGNGASGIRVTDQVGLTRSEIADNLIGTNSAGTAAIGNANKGIWIDAANVPTSETQATKIYDNVISGNTGDGVFVSTTATNSPENNASPETTFVELMIIVARRPPTNFNGAENTSPTVSLGNRIGTNAAGTAALPNTGNGVNLLNATAKIEGSIISGNGASGIRSDSSPSATRFSQIADNYIGVGANGVTDLGNFADGVNLNLKGEAPTELEASKIWNNVISGNGGDGVNVSAENVTWDNTAAAAPHAGVAFLVDIAARRSGSSAATAAAPAGNRIGTNAAGTAAMANNGNGILLTNAPALIEGNLISANGASGIKAKPPAHSSLFVEISDNYVGTNAAGDADLGNASDGISLEFDATAQNQAASHVWSNVVSGNNGNGIRAFSTANGNGNINQTASPGASVAFFVDIAARPSGNRNSASPGVSTGNRIGTNAAGTAALGNSGRGVSISGVKTKVGGDTPADGNIIAYNGGGGVSIANIGDQTAQTGNRFINNTIFSNIGIGIDLGGDGPTPNDTGDGDTGPNNLQNYPVLTAATSNGTSTTTVSGTINTRPNTALKIEIYATVNNLLGGGGGGGPLGMLAVTTNSSGNAAFTATFPAGVPSGRFVSATATTSDTNLGNENNTSEFSPGGVAVSGTAPRRAQSDFDGDGKSDVSVFRESEGNWYYLNSLGNTFGAVHFGAVGDRVVPGDYDGDRKTDFAVWRPSNGTWYILNSTGGFTGVPFGLPTDLPAQGDYDNDGKTDLAVFRPSNGTWFLQQSTAGFAAVQFGANGDRPVPGDYDGDGKTDVAVFRPSEGNWYQLRSTQGFAAFHFGIPTDKVVPADYDGDGKTDLGVYRDGTPGVWFLLQSTAGFSAIPFGTTNDIPAPGDFDGDGKADTTVLRPSNGIWFSQQTTSGFVATQFGQNGDKPIPAGYVPVQ